MSHAMNAPGTGLQRRGAELGMILFAAVLGAVCLINVGLALNDKIPIGVWPYWAGLALAWFVAHLVVRRVAPYADPLLLPIAALLNAIGLVLIYRLDYATRSKAAARGQELHGLASAQLQFIWSLVGIVAFIGVLLIIRDHRTLQRYTWTCMVVGLFLLVLPAVLPASISEVHGARLWIRLGSISVQPGEIAKLLIVVFFAGYLVTKRDVLALVSRRFLGLHLPRAKDIGPILVVWLVSLVVLIFENDFGSSLLFFAIFLVMIYTATERVSWLIIGFLLFAGGAYLAYLGSAKVQLRFDMWLHPFSDPQNKGYQIVQGLFGLATGGVFGTGLGRGNPDKVPYASSDYITATIGEELGLIGLGAILVLLFLIAFRGMKTALSVRDNFGKLLATGLATGFAVQVFVVVGGVTGLIPLTGLTLPFLAYGGTSLVANWILVAVLLRISDGGRRPVPAVRTPQERAALSDARTEVIG